uniref:Uncharacterized protein n=1 Tax=Arundo donax TaxID=35708 RepID=A0A0A9BKT7_ARUDO
MTCLYGSQLLIHSFNTSIIEICCLYFWHPINGSRGRGFCSFYISMLILFVSHTYLYLLFLKYFPTRFQKT